ncbi:MAG: transposase [Candidatus Paceibacterota bacterium]
MSIRKVPFAIGEYYHIYNRGNSKQKIFLEKKNYNHFLKLLYICNSENNFVLRDIIGESFDCVRGDTLVDIGAYCLMPNHFHILVKEKVEGGITKFMQKFSTAYVMYINTKHKRTGSLFEGKFKSRHLNTDKYLKYIFSYMHLNPLKLINKNWRTSLDKNNPGLEKYLSNYKYSSYSEYIGENRIQSKILYKQAFPNYFSNGDKFKDEIKYWISFGDGIETT